MLYVSVCMLCVECVCDVCVFMCVYVVGVCLVRVCVVYVSVCYVCLYVFHCVCPCCLQFMPWSVFLELAGAQAG